MKDGYGKRNPALLWLTITGIWQGGGIVGLTGNNLKFDNVEVDGRYFVTPTFSLGASYTYTMGRFESSTGTLNPHWNQVMGQADYLLSKRTDIYLEGVYQHVSGGGGNPAFDAGVFNLTPASGNEQVVVALGMRHRF